MAKLPVDDLAITQAYGPHLSSTVRGKTSDEPEKLVKTHCCFCGQQCGIQLKVRKNEVIGFEPWEDFPFNRGMLCPKGVKRYLQGSHPDRLLTALKRDPTSPSGFRSMAYEEAIATAAREIARLQQAHGNGAIGVLGGASLTTEKTYLLGKFARVCLKTPFIDYNGRLCMVSAGAANKKAFGIDRVTSPWSDMVGTEVIWIAGSNVAECSPITTNYVWQARERGAKVIVQDPRITPIARTCDLYLPVRPGRDAALFAGVLHLMIENGWIDREFIAAHTAGFEQVAEYCGTWTPARTAEVTGVPERSIHQAAELWGKAKLELSPPRARHRASLERSAERARCDQPGPRVRAHREAEERLRHHRGPGERAGGARARPEVRSAPGAAGHLEPRAPQVHRWRVGRGGARHPRAGGRRVRAVPQDRRWRDQGPHLALLQPEGLAARQRLRHARAREAGVLRRDRLLPQRHGTPRRPGAARQPARRG